MGTFAELFVEGNARIPDDRRKEFIERVKKVYQCGGMMDIEFVNLYGKKVVTIRKAEMESTGMDFFYNYFEDARWENAGFNSETCHVWSNKIGWSHFHSTVVAAYVLEEQYTENVSVAMVDGEPITSWGYVGWLNYLFNEKKHVKNFDTWKLFESFFYLNDEYNRWDDWDKWLGFGNTRYAFISSCEIYAVIYGVDKTIERFEREEKSELECMALRGMKCAIDFFRQYVKTEMYDEDEARREIMDAITLYYKSEKKEHVASLYERKYEPLLLALEISDAPAFIVKAISETFNKDFRELWTGIKDVVQRKSEKLYRNDDYYVVPISTERFFGQLPDDMIPYWEEDGKIIFSEELQEWFKYLRKEFDTIMHEENVIEHPLRYILELMEEADENYYNVFTFADFFEECLENLGDKRYQVLWRLYDMLIHDPELKAAGDVIFVPEGPGHENEGIHYWGDEPKRRLISNWSFMPTDKRNNKGRITLRRYMALVANKPLRQKVFGF